MRLGIHGMQDIKRLQGTIAFLIGMSLLGGGAVWISGDMERSGDKALQEATVARRDIQAKLARAREEQQELSEKMTRFQELRSRGYIGPERRLDWIEAIARIKSERRIAKLDYEFAPQRRLDPGLLPDAAAAAAGSFEIMSSQMRLQMHLLHEGELLAFLADLRADLHNAVQAMIEVRACTIERLTPDSAARDGKAQLKAECTLEWVTLREVK